MSESSSVPFFNLLVGLVFFVLFFLPWNIGFWVAFSRLWSGSVAFPPNSNTILWHFCLSPPPHLG